ncbi:MAG: type I methionyl aminopeptidase [Planctomycetota bacterium]|nr:type I methionyl aminopeptidase [Planctomycetota bacterium]
MIRLKTVAQMKKMRSSCLIIARLHEELARRVKPGVTTEELDEFAYSFIADHGARPAFKGVESSPDLPPFPGTICASVNEELVHGIPGSRRLEEGDIISIDCGCLLDGYYSDAARTFMVGEVSDEARELVEVTRHCLEKAIEAARPGGKLFDIARAVEQVAHPSGFSIVREYVGHGIGRELWEEPQVPNFVPKFPDFRNIAMKEGLVIAIEPMINAGTYRTKRSRGSWTVTTADGRLCAHWENTIALVNGSNEVLTETTPSFLDE